MADEITSIQNKGWTEGFDISDSLSKQTKAINQTVSGFTKQAVNPIKSTVTDIKSGIALIKEKDREFTNKLHSYKSETIDAINSYLSDLTGGKLNFNDFGKVITYKDGFKINKDQLVNMASKTLGFNIKNLPNEADKLANEFLTELNQMTLGLSDGLVNFDGTKVTIAGDWDRKLGENVFSFLTSSSDSVKTIRNFAASNAILNVMLHNNAKIGYVAGYKPFGELYLYESDYHAALIRSISTLLNKGDIDSLKEVISILGETSTYTVRATYPKFAELVVTNFITPSSVLVEDYKIYGEKLISVIESVCGANWLYDKTFMGDVLNIGLASKASKSSINVIDGHINNLLEQSASLTSSDPTKSKSLAEKASNLTVFIATAGILQVDDASTIFKRDFPDAVTF